MTTHSEQFIRKRRSLLLMPAPVVFFATMFFWSLGGGSGQAAATNILQSRGLNTMLPQAQLGEQDTWDKFKLYEIASYDSAKYEEARESDPYFDLVAFKTTRQDSTPSSQSKLMNSFKRKDRLAADPNEEKVNRKIEELYREINRPQVTSTHTTLATDTTQRDEQFSSDVTRLEQMLDNLQTQRKSNPEMEQIDQALDKLLDVQYPERMKEKLSAGRTEKTHAQVHLAGSTEEPSYHIMDSTVHNETAIRTDEVNNGFFGLDEATFSQTQEGQEDIIEAIVHGEQELVSGATIKLRLLDQITIDGHAIEPGAFIYGTCSINGERLIIDIPSIHTDNSLFKVSLKAYDLDGLEGIYVPGAITRDVAKQSSDNALQSINFMSMDQSIGAQAAAAGVTAAKGLFSKKAKLIQVTVKAGYQVLLKNASSAAL
jgi:conjugative transposon TraM protein